MILDIRNLCKSFGDKNVLRTVNYKQDFHSLSIIGPSGGGKSTLIRTVAGLLYPNSGQIFVNNNNLIFSEKSLNNYRKNIGIVFQSYNLFPHLSALDNLTLPLEKVHNKTKKQSQQIAKKYLNRFGLYEHIHKYPSQLSGGQQQRVAIARAVSINPKFLIFDEPTSALDPEYTSEVLDIIEELREEGIDLIIVTHEMGFAKFASDYNIFIDEGIIKESGKTKEIFNNPKSKELKKFLSKILKY